MVMVAIVVATGAVVMAQTEQPTTHLPLIYLPTQLIYPIIDNPTFNAKTQNSQVSVSNSIPGPAAARRTNRRSLVSATPVTPPGASPPPPVLSIRCSPSPPTTSCLVVSFLRTGPSATPLPLPLPLPLPACLPIKERVRTEMPKRSQEAKRGSSSHQMDPDAPKMDIKSIMKDIEFLGSSHMTWKQRKDLENRKVISLGGKPQKTQKLPLSVARVQMKKQKEREQKMLQENAILGRFGGYHHTIGTKKATERRCQEERVLKSTEGHFRNGVLDVKSLLKPSAPRANSESSRHVIGKGKKKKGDKKSHGKRKNGGRKRH
ncbi:uncharacterized protein LOC111380742 [Olea europaea var. sylvestris]|uniref:uncharacterized protein LOC111380742 n=1 Tax=Olea europaea var. sylvestris TaxID=158386 RepID=UPI000C1D7D71|nr:uncharacterized protein LOC111380742 [Olea europaea var. sylvestris]